MKPHSVLFSGETAKERIRNSLGSACAGMISEERIKCAAGVAAAGVNADEGVAGAVTRADWHISRSGSQSDEQVPSAVRANEGIIGQIKLSRRVQNICRKTIDTQSARNLNRVLARAAAENDGVAAADHRARADGGRKVQISGGNVGMRAEGAIICAGCIGKTGAIAKKGIALSLRVVKACLLAKKGVEDTGTVQQAGSYAKKIVR